MKLLVILLTLTFPVFTHSQDEAPLPIFDGKTLDGWKSNDVLVASHWLVSEGQIIGDNPDKKGSVLWTEKNFKDYELTLDYQTDSPDYDSGVFIRSPGHQVQIGVSRSLKIDLSGCLYCPKDLQGKYPIQSDKVKTAHRLGKWNTLKIRVINHRIITHLNGLLIADYMSITMPKEGPIGLQVHGGVHQKMRFKNFDLKTTSYLEPKVVESQYDGTSVQAPEGAIILFDGDDISLWKGTPRKGVENPEGKVRWLVENGYMQIVPRQGGIALKEPLLTNGHLHLEWATPEKVVGRGQGRGNSGVFIQGFPEVQILDSYNNPTYFDGQASALYKHAPPLANASRSPGKWQKYDIYFTRAELDDRGKLKKPAYLTVYHNGILTQDKIPFHNVAQKGTLSFQDHNNPGRFRNIWFVPAD
jgi:hypothetical protein|tara:strand:+ start:1920 stop:3161 length:1242 start_codon:yes stop_codon:yes gene_type:complete